MNLVNRTPNSFPYVLNDILRTDWFGGTEQRQSSGQKKIVPLVNIQESKDQFTIELMAPGRSKESFELALDAKVLTISSRELSEQHQEDSTEQSEVTENVVETSYTRKEFTVNDFERAFTIPNAVDTSNIEANYKDGILYVTLPKREEAKEQPKRIIQID